MTPSSYLDRALSAPAGIKILAHPSVLAPLRSKLSYHRAKYPLLYGALVFRLKGGSLEIWNGKETMGQLEEIFQ